MGDLAPLASADLSPLRFDDQSTSLISAKHLTSFPAGQQAVFHTSPLSLLTDAGSMLPAWDFLMLFVS